MTYDQFFRKLRKMRARFGLSDNGRIRTGRGKGSTCPVVAVAGGRGIGLDSSKVEALGLSDAKINALAKVADGYGINTPSLIRLRRRMLETIGRV